MSENIRVLYSEKAIQERVHNLAYQIASDHIERNKYDLHIICVLKGAAYFACDLTRQIPSQVTVTTDYIQVASYGAGTESSGEVKKINGLSMPITGRDVLVVEDIVDSGRTMQYLLGELAQQKPKDIKICTLLDKPSRRVINTIQPDYRGFEIGDQFVVGYGLDYGEKYRNLKYIGILDPD